MALDIRTSRTAAGKTELIAGDPCDSFEFPDRTQAVVDHYQMTIVQKIDGLHERMWIVTRGAEQFCISWDIHFNEVSIIAWGDTPDTAVENLAAM